MRLQSSVGIDKQGLHGVGKVRWNLSAPALYEEALARGECRIAASGPLLTATTPHTGRSPNDRFIVKELTTDAKIWWSGPNEPIEIANFDRLREDAFLALKGKDLFVQDCHGGADPEHRLRVRVITERAWHSLFARNMFRVPAPEELAGFAPDFTVVNSAFSADPNRHGTNSEAFIVINFAERLVLIGGTRYAGETKKSIFSVLNYLLPERGVLPMHCSANVGSDGDTAIFFGLSGTGKTTLSADPARCLIGDDEHGWSDRGVFNFEGGCYAKVIRLSAQNEPQIFATTRRFGTILENVVMDDDTRELDLDDDSITENTRASYPLDFIPGCVPDGRAGHPRNVVFLTCDAFGVLPPISKLTPNQAMYHFVSGYTAKVAGTERGVTEPTATFSACFGAPFLPRHPAVYAKMLGERIRQHGARCWLVNTGWTGGAYGVGERMRLPWTRAMLNAALRGDLDEMEFEPDPIFGVRVPRRCPGVPTEVLRPAGSWRDADAYREQANKLAKMFRDNFAKFEDEATEGTRAAAPTPI
jgi:phosphoenolpyruvate carboxykinase (ATP)